MLLLCRPPVATLTLVTLAVLATNTSCADTVVVPNAQTAAEGNGGVIFPFDIGPSSMRYQQVFDAADFPGPILITAIEFRPDTVLGAAFSEIVPNLRIDLSTTAASVDGLSTTFASNVGLDNTIVFGPGPLALSSADTPGPGGSRNFDIVILLTTPFFYDPAAGNLLLDVRNFGGAATTFLDAQNTLGDSISRAFAFPITNTTGSVDTIGLVVRFQFTPSADPSTSVPEPASLVLFGLTVLGVATYRRQKRTR